MRLCPGVVIVNQRVIPAEEATFGMALWMHRWVTLLLRWPGGEFRSPDRDLPWSLDPQFDADATLFASNDPKYGHAAWPDVNCFINGASQYQHMFPPKCVEVFVVSQGCSGLREKRFSQSSALQAEKSIRLFLWPEFRHPFSPGPPHCCVPSMPERAGKREWPSEPSWGQLGDNLPEDAIGEQETRGQGSVTPRRSPKVLPTTTRSFPKGERLLRFV